MRRIDYKTRPILVGKAPFSCPSAFMVDCHRKVNLAWHSSLRRYTLHKNNYQLFLFAYPSTTAWSPCLAAARSRCSSDMPPAYHSLPHRRFATRWGRHWLDDERAGGASPSPTEEWSATKNGRTMCTPTEKRCASVLWGRPSVVRQR